MGLGLFNVVTDLGGFGVGYDACEVGLVLELIEAGYVSSRSWVKHPIFRKLTSKVPRGIIANPGSQENGLGLPFLEHFQHLFQGETAAHIRIQHKQPLRISCHDGISEVIQPAGGPQRRVLAQVLDGELGKLGGPLADVRREDRLLIVADQIDLFNRGHFGNGGERVPNERVSRDVEEGLRTEVG